MRNILTRVRNNSESSCRVGGVGIALHAPGGEEASVMADDSTMLIGNSPVLKEVLRAVEAYASVPWAVLILGETGVGKELFARRVHEQSPRGKNPFLAVPF
jgi:transcriptional regulator with GAF, ATPase, and Fis domain